MAPLSHGMTGFGSVLDFNLLFRDVVDGQHGVKLKKAPQHIDGEDIVDDGKFVQNQEKASNDETGSNKVEDAPMELRKRTRSQGLRKTIPRESKKIRVDDTSVAVAPEGYPKDDCNTENIIISNLETNKSGQNTTEEEKTVCNVIEMESEVNISTHDSVKIASQDTQDSAQEANVQKDLEDSFPKCSFQKGLDDTCPKCSFQKNFGGLNCNM